MGRFATVWLSHSRFYGGGERVDALAIAVFWATGETKRREATFISPRSGES